VEAIRLKRWRGLALSARDRALCTISEKLSAAPTRMTASDWQPLRDLGFDDRACLEVAHIVGVFNYLTRLADGLGLVLDPETEAASRTGEPLRRPVGTVRPAPYGR
jgi:alkylhydroperoxidase family enzyme